MLTHGVIPYYACISSICIYLVQLCMTAKPSEVRFWSEERLEKIKGIVSHADLRFERRSIEEINRSDLVNILESVSR